MTSTTNYLEIAIRIAVNAHFGQLDKGGEPYIFHPLRLMGSVSTIEEKIVAVLHDVVEDSSYSFSDLEKSGIPEVCIDVLKLLTHDKDVPYMDYIKEIATNSIAKAVKLADLRDNSDLSRLKVITEKDKERLKKYQLAIEYLR